MSTPETLRATIRFNPDYQLIKDIPENSILPLVNYKQLIEGHLSGIDYRKASFEISLTHLQLNYRLNSLYRKTSYPEFDPDLEPKVNQIAYEVDYQSKYNEASGHAIRVAFHERRSASSPWAFIGYKRLYNQGLESYLNIIKPMLSLAGTEIGDINFSLGYELLDKPENIKDNSINDYLTFRGSIFTEVTYFPLSQPLLLTPEFSEKTITTTSTFVLGNNSRRRGFIISNSSTVPVYFVFSSSGFQVSRPEVLPSIKPGGSLIAGEDNLILDDVENAGFISESLVPAIINQPLYAVVKSGTATIGVQEFLTL